ncbi:hypothetical protein NBRC3280_2927 [Acetobacter pasteurianus NBRC 3280]|uniref:Uncharacterized protein n=2 Tax=Acetobacter pasteurianus TaxID=438 RepID=A0A401X7J1_ACEPA|nr:hypothetical protein [Acetobacter pasteurianus]GCD63830.1 hypothetical protein NBRC3278_2923 [Acetobacter pasteurianus NBRC 3278]GCD70292.1 hypothetical protein NBRC3280_2927 [Acetobacter pasteurianus NBRC 3280]
MTNKSDNSPEMDLETARSEIMTAFLVLGMSEASATEALEKVIEIFKEEGRKEERERLLNPKEGDFPEAIQEFITGMTVSVDVSRHAENDEECGLRYFGTLADFSGSNDGRDKHGLVVMVEKATPNFNFSHPGDSLILDWISKMFVASDEGSDGQKTFTPSIRFLRLIEKWRGLRGTTFRRALIPHMPKYVTNKLPHHIY